MKLKCLHCDHKFDGTISYDELGWHSFCPECGASFDVDVPEGKILMLFAGRETEFNWNTFEDDHTRNEIYSYRAFPSVRSFMRKWRQLADNPDSMWYWVIDGEDSHYVTTGACSPDDREIFKSYWGRLS